MTWSLGLDVIEFVLSGVCNVAIIVSLDRDLFEIPLALQNLGKLVPKPVRLEAAVPVPEGQKWPKVLPRFSYTHQITRPMFERARDNTDYTVSETLWSPPKIAGTAAVGLRCCRTGKEIGRPAREPPDRKTAFRADSSSRATVAP